MSYLIGFAPWIVFLLLAGNNTSERETLLHASVVAFIVTVVLTIPSAYKHRVTSLDIGALVFFPIMFVFTLLVAPETADQWASAMSQGALAIAVGVGILANRPFVYVYAKPGAPPEVWDQAWFTSTCRRLTMGWFIGFAAMAASTVAGGFVGQSSNAALWLNWIIPIALVVVVVKWQAGIIDKMRDGTLAAAG
jgi:small-conductance mechanosensitive channel